MKVGKHTAFMLDFVSDFVDGDISRDHFEMDYYGYLIEHFPMMEKRLGRDQFSLLWSCEIFWEA